MSEEKKYVVGFPFNKSYSQVGLVRRTKPDWQKGRLNGFGGHIENSDDNPYRAMIREFREEANLLIGWRYCGLITGNNWMLYVYATNIDLNDLPDKTDVDMPIEIWDVADIWKAHTINNLNYIIPLCIDEHATFTINDTGQP